MKGSASAFTWEGIAFNTARSYVNNVYFRQAIEYLTDYPELQADALSGVSGSASPYALPCSRYPGYCFQTAVSGGVHYAFTYNLLDAANDLLQAGLIAGLCASSHSTTSSPSCSPVSFVQSPATLTAADLSKISGWYRSQNPSYPGNTATGGTTNGENCATPTSSWTSAYESACLYEPLFYYRSDDPLRSAGATELYASALKIGFTINEQGITDAEAGATIYGAAIGSVGAGGVNATDVNGTSAADNWDMYTFGWVLSIYGPVDTFFFWNSAFLGTSLDFIDYNNTAMNTATDALYGATSLTAAKADAKSIAELGQLQLPYLTWWYENNLWAVNTAGWVGFANVPDNGPDTGTGIFYTSLNAYSTASGKGYGGNLNYVIHSVADPSGMNPLYNTNWVWQVDIWGELYDTPLGTSAKGITQINDFINWMTTSYTVAAFSGNTPSGAGVSDFQTTMQCASAPMGPSSGLGSCPANTSQAISGGEEVTFNFRNNMTFSDNTPITAADYNFSLFAWDLALQPQTPDLLTPDSGELAGPAGLIADQVVGNTIHLYLGSDTVWNLADTIVGVFSSNLFQYFNLDAVATATGTIDLSQPFATAVSGDCSWVAAGCFAHGYTASTVPYWVQYLPNLEVTSSAFYMQTFDPVTGSGILAANPNYQRTAWTVNATDNAVALGASSVTVGAAGSNVILSPIRVYVYNAGTDVAFTGCTPTCSVGSDGWYYVPSSSISSPTVTVYKVVGHTATLESGVTGTVTCNGSGQCSATLTGTSSLPHANYEVVFSATFSFLGQTRTWYQFTGFHN